MLMIAMIAKYIREDDMTKTPLKLSENDIKEMGRRIMQPVLKSITKAIHKEMARRPENALISVNDFVYIIIFAMTSVDANVLVWLRDLYKQKCNMELNFDTLMGTYIAHVEQIMDKDNERRLKEKMN